MKKHAFRLLSASVLLLLAFLPLAAFAEPENADDDAAVAEEIARQTEKLDLSDWEEYFESVGRLTKSDARTIAEFIESRAVNGEAEDPGGLFGAILVLFRAELKKSVGAAAALTAAALLTALSGIVGDEGIRPLLGTLLCTAALTLSAAVLASLSKTAWDAVGAAGRFAEKVTPVMSALLVSLGAPSAAGIFRPLMVFLTGTVTVLVERAVLPIALACGAVGIADALTDGKQLGELIKTGQKTVKWLLGLVSTFYFGVTAVQGLTVSARDGIAVRTAKYAIDRLAPLTGGIIGGTADSVMACALLLKNGVGAVAVLILLSIMLRPLIVLLTGIFVFRVSAALSAPVADPRVPRLFSNAADVTGGLFACAAVTGVMLLLTILVFVTSAGICAGLW